MTVFSEWSFVTLEKKIMRDFLMLGIDIIGKAGRIAATATAIMVSNVGYTFAQDTVKDKNQRPNIVWIVCEDIGLYIEAYRGVIYSCVYNCWCVRAKQIYFYHRNEPDCDRNHAHAYIKRRQSVELTIAKLCVMP